MSQHKLRYSEFWDRIDVDAFEEAIEWTPEHNHNGNDVGFCLFPERHTHGDTTGKFAIQREKRVYNCWACGGGSLLSLTMELYDMGVEEATSWLYQFTEEDSRSDHDFVDEFLDAFRDIEERVSSLPYFNNRVLEKFNDPIPEEFLAKRNIAPHVCELYKVCYSAHAYRPVPRSKKFEDDSDYEGPAVIFPHYWKDQLVGWQSRWLDEDRPEWVPKYTMTTDFPKENTLYGIDNIEWHSGHGGKVMVVESVPSVLFLESQGYASVATFGSSVNDAQKRLLRKMSGGVILAPDNDPAGSKWMNSLVDYLQRYIPVRCLPPLGEPGQDIGDLSPSALEDYLCQTYEPGIDL